ncbi:MAG: hypothetical protein HQL66_04195, partial [Magnetococcales bacterium]|nr:hypothetical protein [Magnetococcales bacterium]
GVGEKAGGGGRPEAYDTSDGRYVGKGGGGSSSGGGGGSGRGGRDESDYHRMLGYQIAARDPRNVEAAKRAREMSQSRAQLPDENQEQVRTENSSSKPAITNTFKKNQPGGGGTKGASGVHVREIKPGAAPVPPITVNPRGIPVEGHTLHNQNPKGHPSPATSPTAGNLPTGGIPYDDFGMNGERPKGHPSSATSSAPKEEPPNKWRW